MKNGTNGKPPVMAVPKGHTIPQPAPHAPQPDGPPAAKGVDVLEGAKAFGLWLLLRRPPMNDEMSKGGIVLPESRRERPAWLVESKGEKVSIAVEVGDSVVFDGTRVMVDEDSGTAWAFAMEGQIMGKLDPEKLKNRLISVKPHIGM